MMKQAGKRKKAGALLITAILAAALVMQTAATVLAEGEKKASLTIQASSGEDKISGVEWSAYQVAEMPQDGELILTKPFKTSGLDIDRLNEAKQSDMQKMAEELSGYVEENEIAAAAASTTDSSGQVKMENLERGLYLICQTGTPGTDLIVTSIPFFAALPMMENVEGKKVMQYDVTARPKLETKEPETGESRPEESTAEESKPEESTAGESGPEESTAGESSPEESSSSEVPTAGTNGGGGPNRDHGGRDNTLRTIINDPDVPLASFPTSPETPELEIVEDSPVPLAALPRLGDMGTGGATAGLLLSLAAASAALAAFKKVGKSEKTR